MQYVLKDLKIDMTPDFAHITEIPISQLKQLYNVQFEFPSTITSVILSNYSKTHYYLIEPIDGSRGLWQYTFEGILYGTDNTDTLRNRVGKLSITFSRPGKSAYHTKIERYIWHEDGTFDEITLKDSDALEEKDFQINDATTELSEKSEKLGLQNSRMQQELPMIDNTKEEQDNHKQLTFMIRLKTGCVLAALTFLLISIFAKSIMALSAFVVLGIISYLLIRNS